MSETVKSTLSADASPFIPRNFGGAVEVSPAIGNGEVAYTPPETLQTLYVAQIPAGYYAPYVPTLPFYTVPYPCVYPPAPAPMEASLPGETHLPDETRPQTMTQGPRRSRKKPKSGRRREQQSARETGASSADLPVLSNGQGTKITGKARNSELSTNSPDLANNAEFPSLSLENRPAPTGEHLVVSYSTALQHSSSSKKLLSSSAPLAVAEEHTGVLADPTPSLGPQRRKGASRRGARTTAVFTEISDHDALTPGPSNDEANTTVQSRKGNSSSARRLRRKPHNGGTDRHQLPSSSPGPEMTEGAAEKLIVEEAPQQKNSNVGRGIRMNTSRREGHHSALARNVIKSEQKGRRRTDKQPRATEGGISEDGVRKRPVDNADVGMQEPPNGCREACSSEGAPKSSDRIQESWRSKELQDQQSQCIEPKNSAGGNNLTDYPPLGTPVPQRRLGEPKMPEPTDTASKVPLKGKGKSSAPLKPLASTNSARPKHKAAINMAIADIMVPKQRQPKKLKENLVERSSKKAEVGDWLP